MLNAARHTQPATTSACTFCGYPISARPVRDRGGLQFCSRRCRDAAERREESFAGRFDFKRFDPEVAVLDVLLPYGIPANSFVLLAGESGIRHRGLQTELVWRTLTRGEPAIAVTFVDKPITIVEHFLTFGWNVLPFLEAGQLRIIDCFTARIREDHQTPDHQVEWNAYLRGFLDDVVSVVHDPSDLLAVESRLHRELEDAEMAGQGILVIDSLNELELQGHELEAVQFIKEVRGDICNRKYVPIITSLTKHDGLEPVHEHDYLFDGIVEMRRNDQLVRGVRLKELCIAKLDGVLYRPHWITYEGTGVGGFQPFDYERGLASVYGSHPMAPSR